MFHVQQATFSPPKRIRLHEEIRKIDSKKIWCWGKNLTTNKEKMRIKKNCKPKANDRGKENNAIFKKMK